MTSRRVPAVTLVGAGPGHRDLVTLRAETILAASDVVVVDRPVTALARELAPRAEIVEVDTHHGLDLVALAPTDGTLVRCYTGDPWLHPDHAADTERLTAAGIAHETVPAVVTEWAALAATGIPVHHRPRAVTVTLGPLPDLPPAVDPGRTLVTTVADLRAAAGHLAASGDPTMPAAVVPTPPTATTSGPSSVTTDHWATMPLRGTLADLAATAPRTPGVIVTGAVTVPGPDPSVRTTEVADGVDDLAASHSVTDVVVP